MISVTSAGGVSGLARQKPRYSTSGLKRENSVPMPLAVVSDLDEGREPSIVHLDD